MNRVRIQGVSANDPPMVTLDLNRTLPGGKVVREDALPGLRRQRHALHQRTTPVHFRAASADVVTSTVSRFVDVGANCRR